MITAVWLVALALIVAGVLAYAGVWKRWAVSTRGFGTFMGFSWLYLGIALVFAALSLTLSRSGEPLFFALVALAGTALIVAIVGFWWLPAFLQPRWFRTARSAALAGEGRR
ncbi:hypothetical protein AB1K54_05180 [Microbacterium sp. BWT-B31]|uniref:hypothetical protein n=1 Tax=Microbacterium sp. BWT-B31 TaxID=3232072 RepID=UPI003527C2A7